MRRWSVQDAKARLAELLGASVKEGPQMLTRRGVETAVLVTIEEWRRLSQEPRKTALDLLLRDPRRFELNMPPRQGGLR